MEKSCRELLLKAPQRQFGLSWVWHITAASRWILHQHLFAIHLKDAPVPGLSPVQGKMDSAKVRLQIWYIRLWETLSTDFLLCHVGNKANWCPIPVPPLATYPYARLFQLTSASSFDGIFQSLSLASISYPSPSGPCVVRHPFLSWTDSYRQIHTVSFKGWSNWWHLKNIFLALAYLLDISLARSIPIWLTVYRWWDSRIL